MSRPVKSAPPPGAEPTMISTPRVGFHGCAAIQAR
jgi:hypothetical protein